MNKLQLFFYYKMQYTLTKSSKKHKKYALKIQGDGHTRIVNFGADGYEDFTTHKDPDRKNFYIKRHQTTE